MAKKVSLTEKATKTAKEFATRKETWKDIGAGAGAGAIQAVSVGIFGKTLGTILSAMSCGALPAKWMGKQRKQIAIMNQTSDATANLLIGEQ